MSTLNQIIQHCISRLSMVIGTSVQTYAEDRIKLMVIEKFETLFDEIFWNRHTVWKPFTLDGLTGTLVENVSDFFDRLSDINRISVSNNNVPLTSLSASLIPDLITGSSPKFYTQHENSSKVVKIVPFTSVGKVYINYRVRPKIADVGDEVPFDENCIVYAVCADYLSDDGDAQNSSKFNELFHQRLEKLKSMDNNDITSFSSNGQIDSINEWGN